jgi:Mn2+/Fe2+ NRAMP family transporter
MAQKEFEFLDADVEMGPDGPRVRPSLRRIGPGLVIAATGVGAGDMVASLAAGSNYGTTLMWAIVVGAMLKLAITEGIGRWYLATGTTPLRGLLDLARWIKYYIGAYLVLLAFVYGAAVTSATALGLNALFPALSITQWAVITGVVSFGLLMLGSYSFFERLMKTLCFAMFVTTVGAAALTAPSLGDIASGFTFRVPDGSLLYALGVIGGVGATITVASYGYWLRDKGWRGSRWVSAMRLDITVGYVMTPLFMIAMLLVGAALLYGTGQTLSGEEGLIPLATTFGEQFGSAARWLFLLGFFSACFTSVIGGWNGFSYMFADLVRIARGVPEEQAYEHTNERSKMFRLFLVWCTFPPMLLFLFDKPVLVVVIYAALGALFMPFFSATLLIMLNSSRVPKAFRNRWLSNGVLGLSLLIFGGLTVNELVGMF